MPLPRESSVRQLERINKQIEKEIGGDIGSKISDMSKQGSNIQWIRNPIKTGIESYEDYNKSMSKIYKFKDFNKKSKVLESVQSYEGGCLMLKLKVYNWDEIKKTINFNDLYKPELDQYGISKCPHITILYPIDWDCDWELIHEYSSNVRIDDIKVCGLGLFENSDYDILKFNVNSKDLTNLHNRLREKLPNNYSFSEYKPHITIAYLKKGLGKKYLDKNYQIDLETPRYITYSGKDGEFSINIKK